MKNTRLLLMLGLFVPGFLAAQEFTGRVTDSTGAVVPKAAVVVHNVDTGIDVNAATTGSGDYTVPYLKPGNYTVSVTAAGFDKGNHTGLNLQVGEVAVVNFTLTVGNVKDVITVTGDALLDVGKADIGEVIENTRVTELPLNGRDSGMLSTLTAGVIWTQGNFKWQRPFDDTQANTTVNGGGTGNVALLMDGVSNEAATANGAGGDKIAYVAPVDAVQEFKIVTNVYDAQYGRLAGGVEEVTLKSGTNKIHGDVYEYARRTFLDANLWANDYHVATAPAGTSLAGFLTPKHSLDQYGAELDGPVVLPKLYNGRDKTFFTLQYENWKETVPNTVLDAVPETAWHTTGNYGGGDGANSAMVHFENGVPIQYTIYDPENITALPQTGAITYPRVSFGPNDIPQAGVVVDPRANIITSAALHEPLARFDPVALKLTSLLPAPNTTVEAGVDPNTNWAHNYFATGPTTDRYRNILAKLDENLTAVDRVSIHYGYWERVEIQNGNGYGNGLQQGEFPYGERSHNFTLEETHTFTPNLLFDFRANVGVRDEFSNQGPNFDDVTNLGWSAAEAAMMGQTVVNEVPNINTSEYNGFGSNNNSDTVKNSFIMLPTFTYVKGKHTVRTGIDIRFNQVDYHKQGGIGWSTWVDRGWTQTNCNGQQACNGGSWDQTSGDSYSSFLLGNLTSNNLPLKTQEMWSEHYFAPFIQDDYKLNRKLTLNLGIRWDFLPAATERNNAGDSTFNLTAINPISAAVTIPGYVYLPGTMSFLGINGQSRSSYATIKSNIQPRFGFAYALNDKTVIRGGAGVSVRTPNNGTSQIGFSSNQIQQTSNPNFITNLYPNLSDTMTTPFASTGIVHPTGSSLGTLSGLDQGPNWINPNYKSPDFWNYSLGFERQFLQHDTVNITYVGTRLYNGDSSTPYNNVPGSIYQSWGCDVTTGGHPDLGKCAASLPNPFVGLAPFQGTGDYTNSTQAELNNTVAMPQFNWGFSENQMNDSRTWYHSLQVTATHKWSSSLTLHGTYTWSKMMDAGGWANGNYNILNVNSLDGNDMKQRATISGVWLLPVGRGRALLPNANRYIDTAIGGWELGSLFTAQSGTPWTGGNNGIWNHSPYTKIHVIPGSTFIQGARPCQAQYIEDGNKNWSVQFNGGNGPGSVYGDILCNGVVDLINNPGDAAVSNFSWDQIRMMGRYQIDTNLSKNFAIVEGVKLQMRLEAFNMTNHPVFQGSYEGRYQQPQYGILDKQSGQSNLPRQVQLSAKFVW